MNPMFPIRLLIATLIILCAAPSARAGEGHFAIAIHGGAGTILKQNMTAEKEKAYRDTLTKALEIGYAVLEKGGSSLDAVERTIRFMEDSPLFNAGKGSVFTNKGTNEMDASIMEGRSLRAGAVAGVRRLQNPITVARLVMEKSPHVMMVGEGAEQFAKTQGVEWVDPSFFHTERRWKDLEKARARENKKAAKKTDKHGTVGVVALDQAGNLAAGTSTGGMTNKKYGRVGDSPIIGAGCYADNQSCAVSATGHGEYFIRAAVAHEIAARIKHRGEGVQQAADAVVRDQLVHMGGSGGVIAMDRQGRVAFSFNTPGMYRGSRVKGGQPYVGIYKK